MADIFLKADAEKLLVGKNILFFGDSNIRALYKDIITLFQCNRLISEAALRKKLEQSYEGDALVDSIGLTRGRNYKEHRRFRAKGTQIEFFFITRCDSAVVMKTLSEIRSRLREAPDVVIMNSTLWDITRWGSSSVTLFKKNMQHLVEEMYKCLPPSTLVIWLTTPPLAKCRGGFLIKQVEFLKHTMRFEAMEANMFAHTLFTSHGYDVLDLHFYQMMNVHRRNSDGIHWMSKAVRFMTNLLFTHISLAWGRSLPGNLNSAQLIKLQESMDAPSKPVQALQGKKLHDKEQNIFRNAVVPAQASSSCSHPPENGGKANKARRRYRRVYRRSEYHDVSYQQYAPYDRRGRY